ncbi:serine hydrolase domain-containing protein [Psychrobacillus sp. FJAT-51614]|uniref:Serine hydrolase domain-containing protein n=1 Tax=Psychrobacillus mangrovi TaxID=3117745 RepID=A0ABU8FAI2_9BACI
MRKKIVLFFFVTFLVSYSLCITLSVQAADVLETEEIDEFVTNYIKQNGLPGAAIVIVKDGKLVYEQGYGHDSNGNPLTAKSKMRLASGSKPITAFSVLQLVDEGKLNLDDPVSNYLPEITMDDPNWKQITIRHLLSHTSGIPDPTIIAPANTLKEGVERIRDWKLQSRPGEKYAYANANYWISAYLAEKMSGMDFADYLQQKVFSPLGMKYTFTTVNSGDFVLELPNGYVTAYGTAIPWTELEQMKTGAGGVVTTASDMGKWLSLHTNEGKNELGEQVLSKELLEESYSPQFGTEKYGLGWSLSSPNIKPARISHSGSLSTYQTQQDIVPRSGYAVAVLLNSFTPTFEHAYEISSEIIELTEGKETEVKAPVPKIIDLSLGVLTLLYLILGIRGVILSRRWSEKRKQHRAWRFYLRLSPQVVPVLLIGWLFFIVPTLQDNSSTIKDAFGIFPAAMILLSIIFIVGLVLTIMRIYYRKILI